jgi:threonylcarbamoyladenosine tRNA methylthiotransferase MtaB
MAASHEAPTAAILTLGCKLNIADSEAMALKLRQAGWRVIDRADPGADAVIVNSCSVTHVADQKSRHIVRQAQKLAPNATVAFTGCMVETAKPDVIDALGAGLVYRQPDQAALTQRLIDLLPAVATEVEAPRPALKTRAFIAAQEGCNDVCAFCIIPRTRGRERSKPIEAIVAEAKLREAEGAREIVITGTQLGAYGRDKGERALAGAIEALLRETGVPRLRISSVQPQDLSPQLIDLWGDPRLCRHFHLALQSGSEGVLQRMRRRYTATEYSEALHSLREAIPDVAITTDVIVGFPGETESEFEESYAFCREAAFAAIHVFPYSQRQGTAAVKLPGQVAEPVKKERVRRLIALGEELSRAYRQRFIGTTSSVLWETQRQEAWEGLTDTYIRVRTPARGADLHNRTTAVRLTALGEDGMLGEVLET